MWPLLNLVQRHYEKAVSLHDKTVRDLLEAPAPAPSLGVLRPVHAELKRGHRALCAFGEYQAMMAQYKEQQKGREEMWSRHDELRLQPL